MSTKLIFAILTKYYHIGSQRGRVPTHVHARRPGNEGGMGGAWWGHKYGISDVIFGLESFTGYNTLHCVFTYAKDECT